MGDAHSPSQNVETSRTVRLPLLKLDICCQCGATSGLRLCSSCGERIYCSTECQKADWKEHKKACGKTERIDLAVYWPFLAYMAELARVNSAKPVHPALQHVVVNNPVPNTGSRVLPDGSVTNLILLGDPIRLEEMGGPTWWPTAPTEDMRNKLFFRICREGFALPILLSICVALLAEMYTTTYDSIKEDQGGKNKSFGDNERFRLQCERSPISDFGICKGSADVKPQDTFGYLHLDHAHSTFPIDFFRGQDPNDHYWIYFKSLKGEEFVLDLCMFTFNFCMLIATGTPYRPPRPPYPPLNTLAGLFVDRELRKSTPRMHCEKQRFSVLRSKVLQGAVRQPAFSDLDAKVLVAFMERVAGRKSSQAEQDLLLVWTTGNREMLSMNLQHKDYLQYPPSAPIGISYDPGEKEREIWDDDEDTLRYLRKWNRRQRKGLITSKQLHEALQRWNELPPDARTAYRHHKK